MCLKKWSVHLVNCRIWSVNQYIIRESNHYTLNVSIVAFVMLLDELGELILFEFIIPSQQMSTGKPKKNRRDMGRIVKNQAFDIDRQIVFFSTFYLTPNIFIPWYLFLVVTIRLALCSHLVPVHVLMRKTLFRVCIAIQYLRLFSVVWCTSISFLSSSTHEMPSESFSIWLSLTVRRP